MKTNIMEMSLKKDDIIQFLTRDPQMHVMEILGIEEFNPDWIEKEEYSGRVKAVIDDGKSFLVTTLSPAGGYICIADAGDVIRKVNPEELSPEELSEYNDSKARFESPNTYINATLGFPDIEAVMMDNVSFYTHEAFLARLGFFIGLISDEQRKREMTEIMDKLVKQVDNARFKEYYEVDVLVKEDDMTLVNWTVAIDKGFKEVCIMRDAKERSDFMYSLGPEYYDLVDACNMFRRKCIGKEERI